MDIEFSHTSIMIVRTRESVIIAADSRSCCEWGKVLENTKEKIFSLRSDNYSHIFCCGSGSSYVSYYIKQTWSRLFAGHTSVDEVKECVRVQAKKGLLSLVRRLQHHGDVRTRDEILNAHVSEIFVVGYEYGKRCRVVRLKHNIRNDLRFAGEEELQGRLEFGGGGARHMVDYCSNIRRITAAELDNMTNWQAMEFAKAAIEYTTRRDWYTGGNIHAYAIGPGGCQRRSWTPVNLDKASTGYVEMPIHSGFTFSS